MSNGVLGGIVNDHLVWGAAGGYNLGVSAAQSGQDMRPMNAFLAGGLVAGNVLGVNPPYGFNNSLIQGLIGAGSASGTSILCGAQTTFNSVYQSFYAFLKATNLSVCPGFVNQNGDTDYDIYYSLLNRGSARTDLLKFASTGNLSLLQSGAQLCVGSASPAASASLDVQSTTKGAVFPRMSTIQKAAISSPVEGLVVYDLTLHKLCVYTGAAWETITSA